MNLRKVKISENLAIWKVNNAQGNTLNAQIVRMNEKTPTYKIMDTYNRKLYTKTNDWNKAKAHLFALVLDLI